MKENFALQWHSETKGMVSEAQDIGVFREKVKHIQYHRNKNNQDDCFFSVNSFISKRLKDNIFELVGLAVDVDFKEEIDAEYIVRLLEDQEFDFNIPRPSYINFSGYGIHLYWKYEDPIPARTKLNKVKEKLIYLHEKINRTFMQVLKDYGSDPQAIDVTRLLRNTGTYNAKYGQKVKAYTMRDYEITYDLKEMQAWLPAIENKEKKIKKVVSSLSYIRNYYTLHCARMEDILKLAQLRGYDCFGHRELFCFLTRYYSYITNGDKEQAKEVMLELNNRFIYPLREYRLIVDTKSAEKAVEKHLLDKKKGYNYSNERLIDILAITEDEEKYMGTIISTKEKYSRNNKRRQQVRRNDNGLTTREQARQEKIQKILSLKEQGLKQKEIAERLGIAKSLVSMYLKK